MTFNPFISTGQHPFVSGQGEVPLPPPYTPPPVSGSPLQFSPMTPNGTRIFKGPFSADCFEWPPWAASVGDMELRFGEQIPPPPLPPELKTGHRAPSQAGPLKPEEPSRSVTELPELPAFTPLEGSVLAGDWMTQLTPVVGTLSAILRGIIGRGFSKKLIACARGGWLQTLSSDWLLRQRRTVGQSSHLSMC